MFWLLNVNIATSGKRHLKRNKCISDKESEPVWEWAGVVLHVGRAQSQWHGWSARHGRKGKRCRVTVGAYFAHDSPLTNYLHIRWSFSWKHFAFWKLFLGLLGMTEPQAVPVAEPVFLRGTRTLWLFSRKIFFDPGHSFAMKQLCPCLSSQKNFPDVTRQDFPGKKYLFIWALIAHLLHPPAPYTQCGQIFHFLKSIKKKKCRNKKMSKSIWVGRVGRFEQRPREKVFFFGKTVVKCIIFVSNEASARRWFSLITKDWKASFVWLQQRAGLDLAHRQFSLAADDTVNKRWPHCVPRPVVPQAAYAGGPTVGQVGLPPNTLTESLPPSC